MNLRQHQGFSTRRLIITIGVIAIIGFILLTVWGLGNAVNNKATQNTEAPVISNPTLPVSGDPYDGWQTYTDPIEKFSFKYPKQWQFNRVDLTDTKGTLHHTVELQGANNFILSYDVMRPDAAYNKGCPTCQFTKVEGVQPPNFPKQLYMVVTSRVVDQLPFQVLSLSDHDVITRQGSTAYAYYPSVTNPGFIVKWDGSYREYATDGSNILFSDLQTFTGKPEVAIAKLILESVSY